MLKVKVLRLLSKHHDVPVFTAANIIKEFEVCGL